MIERCPAGRMARLSGLAGWPDGLPW